MGNENNSSTVVTVLKVVVPIIGTVAVAYIGYRQTLDLIIIPMRATGTAAAIQTDIALNLKDTQTADIVVVDTSTQIPELTPGAPEVIEPPTVTSTSTPIIYEDPVRFMQDYFQLINNRRYEDAYYLMLSSNFREDQSYEEYVSFWKEVDSTEIAFIEIESQTETTVYIYAEVIYRWKSRAPTMGQTTYKLVKNYSKHSWLIDPK